MTLLSRFFGFLRDLVLANVLGAGPVADAFFVAFRLPNHFRAIFAEGAFNAAFVPTFNRVAAQGGREAALLFADYIFALLLMTQLALLALALLGMPVLVSLLAPGLSDDPFRYTLAIELTRITFPYLAFIALTVLISGVLNALGRFAAAAATAVLLNIAMIDAARCSPRGFSPTVGHAAAWGVVASGLLQFLLVAVDAFRQNAMMELRWPRFDEGVKRFWKAFVPATLGSAGVQIAVFADTIIASFLPQGVISALFYADRINQLPVGVVGIAVGTVLLSAMSQRIAAGDEEGAIAAQMRAIELTLLITFPCIAAFLLLLPEVIIRALFMHGAFTAADAARSGQALAAYSVGLAAFMLLKSLTVTFHARGDTKTPVYAMALAVAVNIATKVALMGPLQHVGLALGTSLGALVNVGALAFLGWRRGLLHLDAKARRTLPRLVLAFLVLVAALAGGLWVTRGLGGGASSYPDLVRLALMMVLGGFTYGGMLLALFGPGLLQDFKAARRGKA